MASKTTNKAIEALERRHAAERAALAAATAAGAAVRRAREKRAEELARLDAAVDVAEREADVALAVLAELVRPDAAATLTEEGPARVRLAGQRAAADVVAARVGELSGGSVPVRRRGRPRAAVAVRPVAVVVRGADDSGAVRGDPGVRSAQENDGVGQQ